jgi:uncharacterized protein YbcI
MTNQSKVDYVSSYISKLLRKSFGRGPQSCQTTICNKHVVTYIRGFISPMEEILLKQGQYKEVDYARNMILDHLLDELKGVVQVTFNIEVSDYYHDWNFPNNSGVLVFVIENAEGPEHVMDIDVGALEKEMAKLSFLAEKVPDEIITYPISPSIVLIERKGILVQIEKALIEKGFEQELKFTKDELEKNYFHRDGRFEEILKTTIKDIFIDWNFKEDKSVMVFMMKTLK